MASCHPIWYQLGLAKPPWLTVPACFLGDQIVSWTPRMVMPNAPTPHYNNWNPKAVIDGRYPGWYWEHTIDILHQESKIQDYWAWFFNNPTYISSNGWYGFITDDKNFPQAYLGQIWLSEIDMQNPQENIILYEAGIIRYKFLASSKVTSINGSSTEALAVFTGCGSL